MWQSKDTLYYGRYSKEAKIWKSDDRLMKYMIQLLVWKFIFESYCLQKCKYCSSIFTQEARFVLETIHYLSVWEGFKVINSWPIPSTIPLCQLKLCVRVHMCRPGSKDPPRHLPNCQNIFISTYPIIDLQQHNWSEISSKFSIWNYKLTIIMWSAFVSY